jgi:c-di-GMP-binding flagellar brake protein YcgR
MLEKFKQLLEGALAFFQVRATSKAEERRRLIRLRCDYKVQCVVDQEQFEANILDMGLNGMRLRMNHKLKPGSNVFVYHPTRSDRVENEYVLCMVCWSRKRRDSEELETGLQYADTPGNMRRSWVKFLLKELGFDERAIYTRRKSIRAEASMNGLLTGDDGRELEGTVLNLGAGGALFESEDIFPPSSKIKLRVGPMGSLRVLWLPGIVLHSKRSHEEEPYLTSVRFEDLKAGQVRQLGQYVLHLLKAGES